MAIAVERIDATEQLAIAISSYIVGELSLADALTAADTAGFNLRGRLYATLLQLHRYGDADAELHFDGGTCNIFEVAEEDAPEYRLDVERFFRPVPSCLGHWEMAYAELSVSVTLAYPNGQPDPQLDDNENDALRWVIAALHARNAGIASWQTEASALAIACHRKFPTTPSLPQRQGWFDQQQVS